MNPNDHPATQPLCSICYRRTLRWHNTQWCIWCDLMKDPDNFLNRDFGSVAYEIYLNRHEKGAG